mmetsp:Transcript_29661/g.94926  ORF Transcript_29661/g.94926 Transcript_29661/m.94926 type:complete len:206 (-) Transcript_29661:100-717(-)
MLQLLHMSDYCLRHLFGNHSVQHQPSHMVQCSDRCVRFLSALLLFLLYSFVFRLHFPHPIIHPPHPRFKVCQCICQHCLFMLFFFKLLRENHLSGVEIDYFGDKIVDFCSCFFQGRLVFFHVAHSAAFRFALMGFSAINLSCNTRCLRTSGDRECERNSFVDDGVCCQQPVLARVSLDLLQRLCFLNAVGKTDCLLQLGEELGIL